MHLMAPGTLMLQLCQGGVKSLSSTLLIHHWVTLPQQHTHITKGDGVPGQTRPVIALHSLRQSLGPAEPPCCLEPGWHYLPGLLQGCTLATRHLHVLWSTYCFQSFCKMFLHSSTLFVQPASKRGEGVHLPGGLEVHHGAAKQREGEERKGRKRMGKRRLGGDFTEGFQYRKGTYKKLGADFLSGSVATRQGVVV